MGGGWRINTFKREGLQIKQIEYYFSDDAQLPTPLGTKQQPTCKCNCFRNSPPAPPPEITIFYRLQKGGNQEAYYLW